jgi:hypothetical protein
VLCLCDGRKFLVDHEEISVTHANGDAGALVVVGDRVSTAFKSSVSDLAPSSDVPDSEDAVLADSEELGELWMRG